MLTYNPSNTCARFLGSLLLTAIAFFMAAPVATAHFQMIYSPDLLRSKGGMIELHMPFTHPAANGFVMDAATPLAFYHIRKGKKHNLTTTLEASEWTSAVNTGASYKAHVQLKGLGDNIFVLEMAPYLEESEGVYIQQFAKTIVNVGSFPSDWHVDLNLPAEIVPLTKPYAIYAGGSFTGVVRSHGKAVPFAKVEVEYVNYLPDVPNSAFSREPSIHVPAEAFITMTILADENGTFTMALPKAGQWGFAALGVGPEKVYRNKKLSQDAVIWVQTHEIN